MDDLVKHGNNSLLYSAAFSMLLLSMVFECFYFVMVSSNWKNIKVALVFVML